MDLEKYLALILVTVSQCLNYLEAGSFHNNPGTVSVHENQDSAYNLWGISATCTGGYKCNPHNCNGYRCNCDCIIWIFWCNCDTCYNTCYDDCTLDDTCNSCSIYSNPNSFFEMNGALTVRKKACSSPGCGPTCSASGCLNSEHGTMTVGVTCVLTGYTGSMSTTFQVSVTKNAAPTFYWQQGGASDHIDVRKTTAVGDVVDTMMASDTDSYVDGGSIYYTQSQGPRASWIHGTTLFGLDTSTGQIKLLSSLEFEFSYTFSMQTCVHDRRHDQYCRSLAITLHACFQTPNCTDQSNLNVWDTHGSYTGHGTTDTLFTMQFPQPSNHFPNFNSGWHQLQWRQISSGLNVSAVDLNTGEVFLTGNISIWPAYPSKDFHTVVDVSNPGESCYVTTCTMTTRVWYTNWPIEIRSLPATAGKKEDNDNYRRLHNLVLYDYNYEGEDNFTCSITAVTNDEFSLFHLDHDGLHNYDSYTIYKNRCQDPGCGYFGDWFLCDVGIGCMNHNLTNTYIITIECHDAYGTSATADLTFRVWKNHAPVWQNLPATITINSDNIGANDIIYSFAYSDRENEGLFYNYTYRSDSPGVDYSYFVTDSYGNHQNNRGNVTVTRFLHDWTNTTIYIDVCGHERRNWICSTLTIQIIDFCWPTPVCSGSSTSLTTEAALGTELFSIPSLVTNVQQYSALSYQMSSAANFFDVDSSTGSLTLDSTLTASFPSTTYSINAYVYNEGSCGYAQCLLTVVVTPINRAPTIDNLDAAVTIHEDTLDATTLKMILTADQDAVDNITCVRTSTTPDTDIFSVTESFPGSSVYLIMNKDNPGFTSATTQYTISVRCYDGQNAEDTGVLTVNIELNEAPTITNLPATIVVDPATTSNGTIVRSVQTSDTENDAITYSCTVANSFVPLECIPETPYIRLRRNVDIVSENEQTYTIDVCIGDAKHPNSACGTLSAKFTSSHTHPELSNLPENITIAEDTAISTQLFDVEVSDPDVGDVHTVWFNIEPSVHFATFQLDSSTGVLRSAALFDYETTTQYTLVFSVRDENLLGLKSKILIISITNSNEAPTVVARNTNITFQEDTKVGTALVSPELTCTDQDLGDSLQYTIASGTYKDSFSIDGSSGILTLQQDWDLENNLPNTTEVVIACVDSGGLSATATLTMSIINVNEHIPDVSFTLPDGRDFIQLSDTTSILDNLVTITATDRDLQDDGQFLFKPLGIGRASTMFIVVYESRKKRSTGASATAHLRLAQPLDDTQDFSFYFTIKVSDGEANEKFVGVTLRVDFNATKIEEPPVTQAAPCLTCTSQGTTLVGVVAVEGAIIAGIGVHLIWHFFCRKKDDVEDIKRRGKRSRKSGSSVGTLSTGQYSGSKGGSISKGDSISRGGSNSGSISHGSSQANSSRSSSKLVSTLPGSMKSTRSNGKTSKSSIVPETSLASKIAQLRNQPLDYISSASSNSSSDDSDSDAGSHPPTSRRNVFEIGNKAFTRPGHAGTWARPSPGSGGLPMPMYTSGIAPTGRF